MDSSVTISSRLGSYAYYMSRGSKSFSIPVLIFGLSSCTQLPDLEEATGGIPVREIVLRIKCELSDSFTDANGGWLVDQPSFAWLADWTAQSDLTLQVQDTATFSPGITVTQPLRNGFAVAAGPSSISTAGVLGTAISPVAQSFALAGGASINGQSSRIVTLGFALSMKELREFRHDPSTIKACEVSDTMDLRGRLGLKEWVAEALSPVALPRLLWAGHHPKPAAAGGGGGAQTSPKQPTVSPPAGPQAIKAEAAAPGGPPCTSEKAISDAQSELRDAKTSIAKFDKYPSAAIVQSTKSSIDTAAKSDTDALTSAKSQLKSYFQLN